MANELQKHIFTQPYKESFKSFPDICVRMYLPYAFLFMLATYHSVIVNCEERRSQQTERQAITILGILIAFHAVCVNCYSMIAQLSAVVAPQNLPHARRLRTLIQQSVDGRNH